MFSQYTDVILMALCQMNSKTCKVQLHSRIFEMFLKKIPNVRKFANTSGYKARCFAFSLISFFSVPVYLLCLCRDLEGRWFMWDRQLKLHFTKKSLYPKNCEITKLLAFLRRFNIVLVKICKTISAAETYSEPCQTFKMERFAKIVNGLTVFAKRPILDVW